MIRRNIILSVMLMLVMASSVNACWVGFTMEELIEQSEVILIASIIGKQGGKERTEHVNYDLWKVDTRFILKGDFTSEDTIGTPDERTSLHFELNDSSDTVILFLHMQGDCYTPMTPQGVIPIFLMETEDEKATADNLLSKMQLMDSSRSIDDILLLKGFIEESEIIEVDFDDADDENNSLSMVMISVPLLVVVAMGVVGFTAVKKKWYNKNME